MASIINDFLRRCMHVRAGRKPFTVVLGNESGDMDSIVGSLYLAFYLEKCAVFGKQSYIPVLNFERDDLPLRNDVVKTLSMHGVSTDLLHSVGGPPGVVNHMDLQVIMPDVVLYDHNELIPTQKFLGEKVVGIVDHHFDAKLYMNSTGKLRRIEVTGSACTLVTELYREAGLVVPLAELLLAPIVLDTVNFSDSQKKVTEKDIRACQWLVGQCTSSIDLTGMFLELSAWKNDILGLSVPQHLRRDYKNFEFPFKQACKCILQVGISSIACRFDEVLLSHTMTDLVSECLKFLLSRNLDVLFLAFAGERSPGNYCRQLAFLARNEVLDALRAYAKSRPNGVSFILIDTAQQSDWTFMSYELSDPSVSRKMLAPSLANFFSNWHRS